MHEKSKQPSVLSLSLIALDTAMLLFAFSSTLKFFLTKDGVAFKIGWPYTFYYQFGVSVYDMKDYMRRVVEIQHGSNIRSFMYDGVIYLAAGIIIAYWLWFTSRTPNTKP
jgi:hypothetical protein